MNSHAIFNHELKRRACRWLSLCIMLTPFSVQADTPPIKTDPQITRMQTQIDALNKRLQRLEKIVHSRLSAKDTTPPPATAPAHVRSKLSALQEVQVLQTNWEQLQRGLSTSELQILLGDPASKFKIGRETVWYYKYPGIGAGSVMLGNDGKVNSWQKPSFGF
ncbi:hypothetical protein MNBD_GAMMA24-1601 [hydrothermal vent metagenome]|uniref:Lipoprotein SmpA/OmlA domain-containing protein n=1 Tax=hydrothermal vent metagenome TaxID=652676 RepID=A0A3B1BU48_9ZZZZ